MGRKEGREGGMWSSMLSNRKKKGMLDMFKVARAGELEEVEGRDQ
jgi:hypothetical protein